MYIPAHFEQTDPETLWDFIEEHAFGTLLTVAEGRPFASHVPFLTDRAAGLLQCHVARANPQWQQIEVSSPVLAIFAGPHGYVSPTWYAERGGVPTWNYAVVHAHGEAICVYDAEHKREHVEALAAKYERGREAPWVPDYDAAAGRHRRHRDSHRDARRQIQAEPEPLGRRSRRSRRAVARLG